MPHESVCPVCRSASRLLAEGNTTARAYFTGADGYAIAAGRRRQRLPLYGCEACGHGFSPVDIEPRELSAWYERSAPDEIFLAGETARRRTARAVLRRAAHWQQPGTLLDAGAGPGVFVAEAVRAGWQAVGLDPSAWTVRHGQEVFGVPMAQGALQSAALAAQPFDAVTLFDVIEHVIDPLALTRAAAARLRSGGLLVLTTPRFDSFVARFLGRRWYCIFPAHVQYFTEASLRSVLIASGFDILEQRTHTRYVSTGYIWRRLREWMAPIDKLAAGRYGDMCIPVNLRDEFEVYARKR